MALVINKFNQCTTRLFDDFIVPFDRKINLKAETVRKAIVSFFRNNPEAAKPFCHLAEKTIIILCISNRWMPTYVPKSIIVGYCIGMTAGLISAKAYEFDQGRNKQKNF